MSTKNKTIKHFVGTGDWGPNELLSLQHAINEHAIVSIADMAGNIQFVNEKFCAISGYSAAELIGKNHRILKSGEHSEKFYQQLWQAISGGETWQGNLKNKARDGSSYWVKSTIVPFLNSRGKPYRYVSIRTEITDQIRREEELRRSKELLEQIAQEKSLFFASVSHELRTPLNAILGFSEIMLNEVFGPHANENYRQYNNYIHDSGTQLLELVNDILNISRLESGKFKLCGEDFAPLEHSRKLAGGFDYVAREKNLTIEVVAMPAAPQRLVADPRIVTQILNNLISNACRHTGVGGTVRIAWDLTAQEEVSLSVQDTGTGIPEHIRRHIGQPFVSGDAYVAKTSGGTGLGLYICKQLVEARGGRLLIDSTPGVGTRITALWPKAALGVT